MSGETRLESGFDARRIRGEMDIGNVMGDQGVDVGTRLRLAG